MNRPRITHALVAGAALTALALPLAAPAGAVERTPDLDGVRARCIAGIDRRFTTLDQLDGRVSAAAHVSDGQEATLHATIDATRSGLAGLRAEIEGDTEVSELRSDCTRIVDDHRVYVLLAPQVRLIVGADSAQSAITRLDAIIPKTQAAIDAASAGGGDVTEAQALLDGASAATAEADALSQEVLADVSLLTPADYNAGTGAPELRDSRADLATVAADLGSARADLAAIAGLLG